MSYTAARWRSAAIGVMIAVVGTYLATPSAADDTADAKSLFEEGKALFVAKDYEAALESFKASIELYPTYNGYYNLANCYRALRQYAEALDVVSEMTKTLGLPAKPDIREQFDMFESEIYSVVGTLQIRVKPDGATVLIDGQEVGTSPIKEGLVLGPGIHEVTIRKVGFEKQMANVEIFSEQQSSLDVTLSAAVAELFLTVDIPGALVTVDDVPMGKTPLKEPLQLSPGQHQLDVSNPGYISQSQLVTVVPGDKTAITILLEKLPQLETSLRRADKPRVLSPLFLTALSGTVATGTLSGVLWALASKKAASVQKYNSSYLAATNPDMIKFYDKSRRDARRSGLRLEKSAIGLTVSAGVFAAAAITILIRDLRKRPSKAIDRNVVFGPGTLSVRF